MCEQSISKWYEELLLMLLSLVAFKERQRRTGKDTAEIHATGHAMRILAVAIVMAPHLLQGVRVE